jgi:hypothetical protein
VNNQASPIPLQALSPAARKAVDPATPLPARMMAARGMAPMPPKDLVTAQFVLTFDADAKVAEAAKSSLQKLDARIANAVLGDTTINPHLLGFLAEALAERDAEVEKLLLNPSTPSSAFVKVALLASEAICEVIANNQARVLDEPEIARSLIKNPRALRSTIDRTIDFLVRSSIILDGVPEFEQALLRLGKDDRLKAAEGIELPKELLDESFLTAADKEQIAQERKLILDDEGEQIEEGDAKQSLEQLLKKLTTGQKVALATKGNKAVRARLVRDTNRIVAIAAITAPSVTELEVVQAAQSRTVHSDVITYIAGQKDFIKLYPVKLALACNPKCPLPLAMKFVPTLQKKDQKALSHSKNIPAGVRALATKLIKERN